MIIGIEGPAASGKSTMARTVAAKIGAPVIEGGAWYRALTYIALQENIEATDSARLIARAQNLQLTTSVDQTGSRYYVDGDDKTTELYTDAVSAAIAAIAQNLAVREIIEPQIVAAARQPDNAIVVGRHLHRALPEAHILRLVIDEQEVERRHGRRAGTAAPPVAERNDLDRKTAQLLQVDDEGVTVLDVTTLSPTEQAAALRKFIADNQV